MHDLTQEESYKWTIRVLRKYTHRLSKAIDVWENFKGGEIRYLYKPASLDLAKPSFSVHLAAISKEVRELIEHRKSLQHQTEMFENMTNSASVLKNEVLTNAKIE